MLSSCSSSGLSKFLKKIDEGNYIEAKQIYSEEIFGNSEEEIEAYYELEKRLVNVSDDYNEGHIDYNKAKSIISTIENIGVLDDYQISVVYSSIEDLYYSKNAFESAENLFSQGYYEDALMQYQNVLPADTYYLEVFDRITKTKEKIVEETFAQVFECEKNGDFVGAIKLIDNIYVIIGYEADLQGKYDELSAKYIEQVIDEAEETFSNNKDYNSAIGVITAAISNVGNDPRLDAKLEEYQSYIPILLCDLEPFAVGDYVDINGNGYGSILKDVEGNEYTKRTVFYPIGGTLATAISKSEEDGRIEYYLNGEYSILMGTLYLPYQARGIDSPKIPSTFKVYGDGVLLYEAPIFEKGVTKPIKINVNIENVQSLKIVILGIWSESGGWPGVYSRNPMICAADLTIAK